MLLKNGSLWSDREGSVGLYSALRRRCIQTALDAPIFSNLGQRNEFWKRADQDHGVPTVRTSDRFDGMRNFSRC
jgi:hypothetical protein